MTRFTVAAALAALSTLGGCRPAPPAAAKYTMVYGQGFGPNNIVMGQAVQAAHNAVNAAAGAGCKPISVGNGAGPSGGEQGPALATVVVLLECPVGAPDILAATGGTAPPTP